MDEGSPVPRQAAKPPASNMKWVNVAIIAMFLVLVVLLSLAYRDGYLQDFFAGRQALPATPANRQYTYIEPELNITPHEVPENLSYIGMLAFDGINNERARFKIAPLAWNGELAYVAQLHSQDMAERGFFSHDSPENVSHGGRMAGHGIYYYSMSAENLASINYASTYTYIEGTGQVINKTYKTLDEVAEDAVRGWMGSKAHMENAMLPSFNESGVGVAYYPENESFFFTQIFITRIHCGYEGASCCYTEGYLPWCYGPWNCSTESGLCG